MVEGNMKPSYIFYARDVKKVSQLTKQIQQYMFSIFKSEKCFKVRNLADVIADFEKSEVQLTIVVGGIAGISLLVAGIGIMNIMLVSVTERTREIGIRKALGAKKRDILSQFVIEAATTSLIGGMLGIVLGQIVTNKFTEKMKVASTVQLNVILLAFGISVGIGVLFGYLPAHKAAKLNPIDALRNE